MMADILTFCIVAGIIINYKFVGKRLYERYLYCTNITHIFVIL